MDDPTCAECGDDCEPSDYHEGRQAYYCSLHDPEREPTEAETQGRLGRGGDE
jgi:hypothetical protein